MLIGKHGHSCAHVGTDKFRIKWASALMLSATLHNSTQRLGINTQTKGIYFTAAAKGKVKAAKPKVEPNSSYTFVIMLMNDALNSLNGSMQV